MTQFPPILAYIHARFRDVLGEPTTMLALDSQWTLRSSPQAPAIFVLVNGSYEKPAVWVFDPYVTENVWRTSITANEQVDRALVIIQERFAFATSAWAACQPTAAAPADISDSSDKPSGDQDVAGDTSSS